MQQQQPQHSKSGFLGLSHTRVRDGIIDVEKAAGGNTSKKAKYHQRELLNGKLTDFLRYGQPPCSWSLWTTQWTLDDSSSVGSHALSSVESLDSDEEWIEHLACLAADCPEDTGTSESSLLSVMAKPETGPSPSSFRNIIGANKRRERTKSSSAADLLCYPPGLVPPSVKNNSQKDNVKWNHAYFDGDVDDMKQNIKSVSPPPGISRQLGTSTTTTVLPKLSKETMTLVCLTSFPFRIMHVNDEFARETRRRKDLIGKPFLDLFVPSDYGGTPVSIFSCDTLLGVFQNDIVQVIANGSNHHDILYCSIDVQPSYFDPPSQLAQPCSSSNSDGDSRIVQNFIVTLHPIHKTNSLDTELDEKASSIAYLPMPEGLLRPPGAK